MSAMNHADELQALTRNFDALISFADRNEDHVLAATLEDARLRFNDRYFGESD